MTHDPVLQLADGVTVRLVRPFGTTVERPGGPAIEIGPHGLSILEAFRRPTALQAAVVRLAAERSSTISVAEMMAAIQRLRAADVLVSDERADRRLHGARGFAAAAAHIAMLDDRVRTQAFLDAIDRTVKPGDVVVDLGTGTGVLAIAAARAGARRVFAIEATAIADVAAAMIAGSGVADRITLIRGWSTEAAIGDRADVLVTETLGHDPWGEGFLHLVYDARRRLLRPEARIIPARVRRLAQPVGVPPDRRQRQAFSPEAARRWSEWYGIDFRPLASGFAGHTGSVWLQAGDLREWPLPCPPVKLDELNVSSDASASLRGSGRTIATQTGIIDGALLCWEADLSDGISLSTLPTASAVPTSWRQRLLLAPRPQPVQAGEPVEIVVTFGPIPRVEVTRGAVRSTDEPAPSP